MEEKIDLIKLITKVLKSMQQNWWMIVVCVILCGGLFGWREKISYYPMYESSATFIVQSNAGQASSSYTDRLAASQIVEIFPYILRSGELSQVVASELGYTSIPGSISIKTLGATPIFTVTVRASKPDLAHAVLESVLDNYPTVAEYILGNTNMVLMDETGIVHTPVNQLNIMNGVKKGAILGFGFAFCIIVALALLKKTVDSKSDLKNVTSMKCLSSVPVVSFKKKKSKELVLITNPKTGQGFQEAMRTVAIRLAHHMKKQSENFKTDKKVILITSTLPGEGKSTMSCNMALALAGRQNKVVLIDCDLRNPSIFSTMGLDKKDKGLRELLTTETKLGEVLQHIPDSTLDIIPGGKPTSKASEILSSAKMKELIEQLKKQYDYVILDCAPIGMLSDAMMLIDAADTGLFVVKQDYASVKQIQESIEVMNTRGLDLVGYVINGAEHVSGRYGSYYGHYGSYGKYGKYGKYGSYYGRYGARRGKDEEDE